MDRNVALIGFGEAGMAFAEQWRSAGTRARAFDIKTDDPATAAAKNADFATYAVEGCTNLGEALQGAALVLSLVTADQVVAAAGAAAPLLAPHALYCDFNSVAPQTKREAAAHVEAAGGRYADVAVMAPVRPSGLEVPLLVSGAHAAAAAAALTALGFEPCSIGGEVGSASTVKMLRSVLVKGVEALTTECFTAAIAAGVADEVAHSLGQSWPGVDWLERAEYNLERMMVHGRRRAAEMEEAAATLDSLSADSTMSRATAQVQHRIGVLDLVAPDGLEAKARALRSHWEEVA